MSHCISNPARCVHNIKISTNCVGTLSWSHDMTCEQLAHELGAAMEPRYLWQPAGLQNNSTSPYKIVCSTYAVRNLSISFFALGSTSTLRNTILAKSEVISLPWSKNQIKLTQGGAAMKTRAACIINTTILMLTVQFCTSHKNSNCQYYSICKKVYSLEKWGLKGGIAYFKAITSCSSLKLRAFTLFQGNPLLTSCMVSESSYMYTHELTSSSLATKSTLNL